jgi:hypothetical protein
VIQLNGIIVSKVAINVAILKIATILLIPPGLPLMSWQFLQQSKQKIF